jgi:predicted  nucleic acid-binding Zn-ribbon protein
MPHQCTDCGRAFEDGSKEMLSGCPDCGGNTFQFRPEGVGSEGSPDDPAEPPEPPEAPTDSSVARTVGNAATVVRDIVSTEKPDPEPQDDAHPSTPAPGTGPDEGQEDTAQASARSEVVSPEDLSAAERTETTRSHPTPVIDDGAEQSKAQRQTEEATGDRPDLSELREKLNDQFESIKVLEPGQYELNLMELYDREEYIIALQEDGKYTIQVPERWNDS